MDSKCLLESTALDHACGVGDRDTPQHLVSSLHRHGDVTHLFLVLRHVEALWPGAQEEAHFGGSYLTGADTPWPLSQWLGRAPALCTLRL